MTIGKFVGLALAGACVGGTAFPIAGALARIAFDIHGATYVAFAAWIAAGTWFAVVLNRSR